MASAEQSQKRLGNLPRVNATPRFVVRWRESYRAWQRRRAREKLEAEARAQSRLRSYFVPEGIGHLDTDGDGEPDAFFVRVTNGGYAQRLTGVGLAIDNRVVPVGQLRIDNGYAVFRADMIRRVRFEPGVAMELRVPGTVLKRGRHRLDIYLSGEIIDIPLQDVLIGVDEDGVFLPALAPKRRRDDVDENRDHLPDPVPAEVHLLPVLDPGTHAWIPLADAARVAAGNLLEAIRLADEDPNYTFAFGQLHALEALQRMDPSAVGRLRALVEAGRAEPVCALAYAPDTTLLSGESIIRQMQAWQRTCVAAFGRPAVAGWLAHGRGAAEQLPQLFRLAGIKGHFNAGADLGDDAQGEFFWRGLDGTRLLTHALPADFWTAYPIPTDPVAAEGKLVRALSHLRPPGAAKTLALALGAENARPQRGLSESLEHFNATWPGTPVRFSLPTNFLRTIVNREFETRDARVFQKRDDAIASRARLARVHRRAESALRDWETMSLLRPLHTPGPVSDGGADKAWRAMMPSQARGALDGCHREHVHNEILFAVEDAHNASLGAIGRELSAVAHNVSPQGRGDGWVVVGNGLGFSRREAVEIDVVAKNGELPVIHSGGRILPTQVLDHERYADGPSKRARLLFFANVPSAGYRVYDLAYDRKGLVASPKYFFPSASTTHLQNAFVRFEFDERDGAIKSAHDVRGNQPFPMRNANRLVMHDEDGTLDRPRESRKPIAKFVAHGADVVENGPLRAAIRFSGTLGGNDMVITYRLDAGARRLEIITDIEFRTPKKSVFAEFPTFFVDRGFHAEVPFGIVPHREAEEDAVLNFCERFSNWHGVAFLNEGIPAWRLKRGVVRATLLRSFTHLGNREAGPTAMNLGRHRFRYAVHAHPGTIRDGKAWKRAQSFVRPLRVVGPVMASNVAPTGSRRAPDSASLARVDRDNVMLSSLRALPGGDVEMRVYETVGELCDVRLFFGLPVAELTVADLNDETLKSFTPDGKTVRLTMHPFEVKTCRLRLSRDS